MSELMQANTASSPSKTIDRFIAQSGRWLSKNSQVVAVIILLVMFGLTLHSLKQKSPTFDEQSFITRGLGYLRGENKQMRVGHPLGLNALNALFLVGDQTVVLPTDDPSWTETRFHRPSELFLWEIGNNVEHVMLLARLPTLYLGLILAAVTGRWAWEVSGRRTAGLLAMLIIGLDPNILAHMRLTTTDLGLAALATLAGYTLWRYLNQPGWRRAIAAGIAMGLLQNTKFTAMLLIPLFIIVIALATWARWRLVSKTGGWRVKEALLPLLIAYPLSAFLTLWACYGFNIGPLPPNLPTMSWLSGLTLPLADHIEQLLDLGGRMQKSTPAFLLGNYSDQGWWYYFPVTFLLKTPLPILLLLLFSFAIFATRFWGSFRKGDIDLSFYQSVIDYSAILIPPLGYFAIALTSEINLGYRHLLPVLPFLSVFISVTLGVQSKTSEAKLAIRKRLKPVIVLLMVLWLVVATLWISPDFLAFFNVFAGGPDNGWRYLVDSNLDWGQDLMGLKAWMEEEGVDHVWLSYFGEARPSYYGISYSGLDSNPPRLMNPYARPYYPPEPAPGIYAISATTLQGVHFNDHDLFASFRNREPLSNVGHSMLIYEVQAEVGAPANVSLGGIQVDELPPAVFAQFGTNDVTPGWFSPEIALLIADEVSSWVALGGEETIHPFLLNMLLETADDVGSTNGVRLFRIDPKLAPKLWEDSDRWTGVDKGMFSQGKGQIDIGAFQLISEELIGGEILSFLTIARQVSDPTPVKMFIHLTNEYGEIIGQWDGLGAFWEGWRQGDRLVQMHHIVLPSNLTTGNYQLWAGFYHPNSLERWSGIDGDRALLTSLMVP